MPARTRRVRAKATGTPGHRTSGRTATSPDITAKSPAEITQSLDRTAPHEELPEAPSGPKIGRPEKGAGTAQDRRPDRGGNGPENTRFGAENREFSDPQKCDKKLHRSTANLDSIS